MADEEASGAGLTVRQAVIVDSKAVRLEDFRTAYQAEIAEDSGVGLVEGAVEEGSSESRPWLFPMIQQY